MPFVEAGISAMVARSSSPAVSPSAFWVWLRAKWEGGEEVGERDPKWMYGSLGWALGGQALGDRTLSQSRWRGDQGLLGAWSPWEKCFPWGSLLTGSQRPLCSVQGAGDHGGPTCLHPGSFEPPPSVPRPLQPHTVWVMMFVMCLPQSCITVFVFEYFPVPSATTRTSPARQSKLPLGPGRRAGLELPREVGSGLWVEGGEARE